MNFPHTLYYIRHGETDWNRVGRMQGQTETDLNATGRGQAARNGDALAGYFAHNALGAADFAFVASPMNRTRQTAEIVRQKLGLSVNGYPTDDRLKEIAFGDYEGLSSADIKARHPDQHAKRKADRWVFAPPRGESYADLFARVGAWLATVDRDMIVVSHGGVSRVLRGHLLGLDPEAVFELPVPQDRFMILGADRCDYL
ncbi:MAG: histidine phosphatase family protein [Rhodobiaceae bacterium]|nr:histidine phosphatase family protein [Rhodobiaceae bacterium]